MDIRPKESKYVISISFANYLKAKTGMPKVMMAHQQMYNENNISYVSLFSVKKNICKDKWMLFCKFGLIVDGNYKGIYQMSQLIRLFAQWHAAGKELMDIHIHHLLYIKVELIQELLDAFYQTSIKVYLHDYYYACSNYNLLRNDMVYCGGKGLTPEICGDCAGYVRSRKIEEEIHRLFKTNEDRICFISPSEITRDIFSRFHPEYSEKIKVIPHQQLSEHYTGNLAPIEAGEKIRVAFLGMPSENKGWKCWKKIVEHAPENRYEFIVFNSSDDQYEKMKKVKVAFSQENLNAMTDALRAYKVHIVILWSIWPETYSYTCFEAFSANTFLITGKNSGNIADIIKKYENGIVLGDEKEIEALFACPERLRELVNDYREKTAGGPLHLYENDTIVKLSISGMKRSKQDKIEVKKRMVNYPLLILLNFLYDKGKA